MNRARREFDPDQLRAMVDEGLTLAEMGKRLNTSYGTVRRALERHGLKTQYKRGDARGPTGRPKKLDRAKTLAAVRKATKGRWSRARTADLIGVSRSTFYKALKLYEIPWWDEGEK